MICPKCKNNIPDNVVFCPVCGGSTGVVPQPPLPQPNAVSQPTANVSYGVNTTNQPQQNQPGTVAQSQSVQQNAPYQQSYAPANVQSYNTPQPTLVKKKMGLGAIVGIVIGGIFGLILLLCITVALFSAVDSGGGYSGGYNPPEETIDFILSGTYDDEGREIVCNESGDEIGFVYDGEVYFPVEEGYYVVCDKDGRIIGRSDDPAEGDSPFSDNDGDAGEVTNGATIG